MPLLRTLLFAFLTYFVLSQPRGKGRNPERERVRRERREKRRARFSRVTKKRLPDETRVGSRDWDNFVPKWENEPKAPEDKFEDTKRNGRWVTNSNNGEQWEYAYTDDDILEMLAEELDSDDEYADEDIGEESQDTRRLEAIIGDDERFEVRGNPLTQLPAQWVGKLTFKNAAGQTRRCSGIVVNYDWVLTAAHCLHEGNGGSWFTDFKFYPRINSKYSSFAITTRLRSAKTGWTQNRDWNWDIGLVQLTRSAGVGRCGFGTRNALGTSNNNDILFLLGYPSDASANGYDNNAMLSTFDEVDSSTTAYTLYFKERADVWGGMSGGPWYRYLHKGSYVHGVHSRSNQNNNWAAATRINKEKYDWICSVTGRGC